MEDSEDGTIGPSTIRDFHRTAARLVAELGRQTPITWLGPEDFRKLAKAYRQAMSPSQAKKAITITRQIFNWLYQNEHILAPRRATVFHRRSEESVARGHYLQVRDSDFQRALESKSEAMRQAVRAATQPPLTTLHWRA